MKIIATNAMVIFRTVNYFRNFKTNVQRCLRHYSFTAELTAYLAGRGVSKHVIDDNPFLLDLKIDALHPKIEILCQMRPRHIDDFVPLLKMEEPILRDVAKKAIEEYDEIPEKHRIYYFSRKLQIAPVTVSKFCSRHEAIFFLKFTGIVKKLNILFDYNVQNMQILQSLYVFNCADNILYSRLDQLLRRSHDYKPSYFKLTDDQFRRAIGSDVIDEAKEIPAESAGHKLQNQNIEKSKILAEISKMLSCDDETSNSIYYDSLDSLEKLTEAKQIMELLANNGVGSESIQSNSGVLTLPYDQIKDNMKLIREMRPISSDDFFPLVAIKTKALRAFANEVNKREIDLHPIYLFSKRLNITPAIVSKHFANHSKLFFYRDFAGMRKKLDLLVAYNVEPMSILSNGVSFGLSATAIETQLQRYKANGMEKISSWMIYNKQKAEILVAKTEEEKTVLGECADTVDYIATRLNWDAAIKKQALKRNPSLVKCNVIRVKNHLDYLLNHFTVDEINATMYVFRASLDELKRRMAELADIGLVPEKLYVICLDKRRYLDMVWNYCKQKDCPAALESFRSIEKRVKKLKVN